MCVYSASRVNLGEALEGNISLQDVDESQVADQ